MNTNLQMVMQSLCPYFDASMPPFEFREWMGSSLVPPFDNNFSITWKAHRLHEGLIAFIRGDRGAKVSLIWKCSLRNLRILPSSQFFAYMTPHPLHPCRLVRSYGACPCRHRGSNIHHSLFYYKHFQHIQLYVYFMYCTCTFYIVHRGPVNHHNTLFYYTV